LQVKKRTAFFQNGPTELKTRIPTEPAQRAFVRQARPPSPQLTFVLICIYHPRMAWALNSMNPALYPRTQGVRWPAAAFSFGAHALLITLLVWVSAPSVLPPAAKPRVVTVSLLQHAPVEENIAPVAEPPPPPPPPEPKIEPKPEPAPTPVEPKPAEPVPQPEPEPQPEPQPVEQTPVAEAPAQADAPQADTPVDAEISEEESLVEPDFRADYLRNPAPAYPRIARKLGEEGEVLLKVLVNPQGRPITVELDTSSGFARLDKAAIEAVQRWSFVPARRAGRATEAWVIVPIVFNLR